MITQQLFVHIIPLVFVVRYCCQVNWAKDIKDSLRTVKGKKVRSYISWYPVLVTAQSALHFTPWQTCSFQRHLDFSWKQSAMLQLLRRLFVRISTTVCSQVPI